MQVVILCGGSGTRLRPLTYGIPKPLIPISSTNSIELVLNYFKFFGHKEFVFCSGYKHEMIEDFFGNGKRHGVKIIHSPEKEALGSAGALKNAQNFLETEFFVANADNISNYNLPEILNWFHSKKQLLTVDVRPVDKPSKGAVKIGENSDVSYYEYSGEKEFTGFAMSGLSLASGEILHLIPFGFQSLEIDIFSKLISMNMINAFVEDEKNFYYSDAGTPESLDLIKNDFDKIIKLMHVDMA